MDLSFKNTLVNAEEISFVSKFISYLDNRLHVTFTDKSSLILHSGSSISLKI